MPTKRMFDMTLLVVVGSKFAWGLVRLWAHRTSAEPGTGPATRVAEAVVVAA